MQKVDRAAGTALVILSLLLWVFLYTNIPKEVTEQSVHLFQSGLIQSQIIQPKTERVTGVTFVGDVLLARDLEKIMQEQQRYYPFYGIYKILNTDYVFGNFEASVPKQHVSTPAESLVFSVPSTSVSVLSDVGFTHMSLANNHTLDFAQEGYVNTVEVLSSNELEVFGHPKDISPSSVSYIKVGDTNVSVLALHTLKGFDLASTTQLILDMSELSELQIVYVHWGTEYELIHSDRQEEIAHSLIDLGIDVVVGHHPHVVQDIERYNKGVIFYSLGNFVFDQYFSEDVQTGLIVSLSKLEKSFALDFRPVTSIYSPAQPRLMSPSAEADFLADLANRSATSTREEIKSGRILIDRINLQYEHGSASMSRPTSTSIDE